MKTIKVKMTFKKLLSIGVLCVLCIILVPVYLFLMLLNLLEPIICKLDNNKKCFLKLTHKRKILAEIF